MEEVREYDRKYNTNIALELNQKNVLRTLHQETGAYDIKEETKKITNEDLIYRMLNILKNENISRSHEILNNQNDFWYYLPAWPALLFGGLGIFLTTFIRNFANTCYTKLPDLLCDLF